MKKRIFTLITVLIFLTACQPSQVTDAPPTLPTTIAIADASQATEPGAVDEPEVEPVAVTDPTAVVVEVTVVVTATPAEAEPIAPTAVPVTVMPTGEAPATVEPTVEPTTVATEPPATAIPPTEPAVTPEPVDEDQADDEEFDLPTSAVPLDFESVILWLTEQAELGKPEDEIRNMLMAADRMVSPDQWQSLDIDGDGSLEWAVTVNTAHDVNARQRGGDFVVVNHQGLKYRYAFARVDFELGVDGAPLLRRALDMTGDNVLELVVSSSTCSPDTCVDTYDVGGIDDERTFSRLFFGFGDGPIVPFSMPAFEDRTGDGLADMVLRGGETPGPGGGPAMRASTQVWAWNAANKAVERVSFELDASELRVHRLFDANALFDQGLYLEALALYTQAADDASLLDVQSFVQPAVSTDDDVRQFALFRMMLIEALLDRPMEAGQVKDRLLNEYPTDVITDGAVNFHIAYFLMFEVVDGCQVATDLFVTQPNPAGAIENMGFVWPLLSAETICPITE